MNKKFYSYFMVAITFLNLILTFPNISEAAELTPADVVYSSPVHQASPSDEFLFSNSSTMNIQDVTIDSTDPITKVELKDASGNVHGTLVNAGGNKYRLSSPLTAERIEVVSSLSLELGKGPFQWFRDPGNRRVWMYDYDEPPAVGEDPLTVTQTNRHYLRNPDIVPQPSQVSCDYTVRPIENLSPFPTTFPDNRPCNQATTTRSGNLSMPAAFDFNYGAIKIPRNYVSGFNLQEEDLEFTPDATMSLRKRNITNTKIMPINQSTFGYRFDYTITFDTVYDNLISDDSNGIVIEWFDNWTIKVRGNTYKYPKLKAYATTGPPATNPDLTVNSLTGPGCIESNVSAHFKYTIENKYVAVSKGFKTSISVDGISIATHDFPTGIGITTLTGEFDYTFSANTMKSITIFVDSNDDINEGSNNNNNSLTVNFTAVNHCMEESPDLVVELSVRFPVIEWKDMNIFEVDIKNPNNSTCTPVEGRFAIEQGTKAYQYPYRPVSGMTDDIPFAWNGTKYPGDMAAGNVKVYYALLDSCGKTAYAGPKSFEIIKTAGAPTVSLAWYDTSTNQEVIEVVQGANVYLKPTISDSRNEKVTRLWNFNNGSPWVAGLPLAQGWSSPLNAAQYNNITASEKGSHKVCVTGTNESGVSATGCSILYVIGPEPTAVIDVSGWLKEDRRIQLSGERSSSPKHSTLTYAWSINPVAGETQGTLADLTYINPLTGKLKDFKTSKLGQYKISLIVTDTEGLTGEAVEIIDVAPDLDPIASNTANSRATRELSDGGLATYTIEGTVMSIDQDIISKRFWYFSYDANNDKSFNDAETTTAIDEDALIIGWEYTYMAGSEPLIVTKTNAHILTLKGKHVGGYQWRLQGIEIPGQPTDLRY
ncbi:CARDB domain-containing protein [Paenibacillus sp. FSL H7-0331]|uniref:CARDB domain-containing protein n=1 Tax=Paenibacillus sp. FSL H7-0331 TaxID=1920421 RepID=UPI00096FE81C|nr:CARDB domain-containing protein [Paenibacillus sp. FSL H7-0331]OME95741.1 hypothetical protein BK127_41105 [Paenibacillus sp. FSL H7-0331]